jgi:hypothetical protein
MRRKSLILALLVVAALLGAIGTSLACLVWHEPAFYRRGAVAPGPQRQTWSGQFLGEMNHLSSAIQREEETWDAEFTTEQINAFLQEDFIKLRLDETMLPENIDAPRVALDDECLRLGFRYGYGRWSTIITVDLRLWVAQGEANTVALELLGLHAGALPVSAQSLLEHVSEAAQRSGVDVSWYRHDGHPVALLRFGPDQPRTTVHLKHVEIKAGRLVLQGRSNPPPAASN